MAFRHPNSNPQQDSRNRFLQLLGRKHAVGALVIYNGTANPAAVAKRHAANKVARKQRAVNRQNGSGR